MATTAHFSYYGTFAEHSSATAASADGTNAVASLVGRAAATGLPPSSVVLVAAKTAATAFPSVADVTALVPKGQTLGTWRNQIWGTGAQGAKGLIGSTTAAQLSDIPGLNVGSATTLPDFYQGAVSAGKGGATAPVRVDLLNDIIKTLGGG